MLFDASVDWWHAQTRFVRVVADSGNPPTNKFVGATHRVCRCHPRGCRCHPSQSRTPLFPPLVRGEEDLVSSRETRQHATLVLLAGSSDTAVSRVLPWKSRGFGQRDLYQNLWHEALGPIGAEGGRVRLLGSNGRRHEGKKGRRAGNPQSPIPNPQSAIGRPIYNPTILNPASTCRFSPVTPLDNSLIK